MGLKMAKNKLLNWISKLCAEDVQAVTLSVTPESLVQKLSSDFTSESADLGVVHFFKKTIFPGHHYLEIRATEKAVEFRLRVRGIDRFFVALTMFAAAAAISVGVFLVVTSIVSSVAEKHYFGGGVLMATVGVGLIFFVYWLYRFFRWGAGLADPLRLLDKYGVNPVSGGS